MKSFSTAPPGQRYMDNTEPPLSHILRDPTFLAVLQRDGLTVEEVCAQLGLSRIVANDDEACTAATAA